MRWETTAFVWSKQVKRVVTGALSHIGESWLQPLVVEISWSVLHWFVLLEKCVSCYAGKAPAQPNKGYFRQAYFLLGIQINKIILDQVVCRSELESKNAWSGDLLWFFPFFQSPEIKCYLLRATGRRWCTILRIHNSIPKHSTLKYNIVDWTKCLNVAQIQVNHTKL